jgi:hypothetical protein
MCVIELHSRHIGRNIRVQGHLGFIGANDLCVRPVIRLAMAVREDKI